MRRESPLGLLMPAGRVQATLVVGKGPPADLVPPTQVGAAPDFAVVAPDADERGDAWAVRAASEVAEGLGSEGTAVVLAPPLSRRRIVRSLERRGFGVAGAFLHLPSFEHTVFVVPLRREVLLYVLRNLVGRRSWRHSLARLAARGPRLLRTAAPSVAVWLRRDGRAASPDWLEVRDAVLQLGPGRTTAVVHGFDGGDRPSVVAKVRAQPSPVTPALEGLLSSASSAGIAVPTLLRRLELGGLEATVERALPGRPAASALADAGDAQVFALLEELSSRLERWSELTSGERLSSGRLQRETVDRAVALLPLLGSHTGYVDRLRALTSGTITGSVVAAHNDLTTWNILVDRGRLAVVDWDEAEPEGLPLGDFAYAAVDAFTVAGGGDRLAAYRRCFGDGDVAEWVAERLRRLERAAELTAEAAELCLHACWLRHASNERERSEEPTPFLGIVREIVRGQRARPVGTA